MSSSVSTYPPILTIKKQESIIEISVMEFGLNSEAILVADKHQSDKRIPKYPDEIINYGKQMQILTVSDDESLKDIAQTLYDIINE